MGQEKALTKTMKTLKRDNWTNDEVIEILKGMKLLSHGQESSGEYMSLQAHNEAIDTAIEEFYDFKRDPNDEGQISCKAYCLDDKMVYHIGRMPPR